MADVKTETLARTLEFLVEQKYVPGLLPKDVLEAAALLREQEAELKTLRTALAAKDHHVSVSIEPEHFQSRVRAQFVIADPRIYYAEMMVDDRWSMEGRDWREYVTRLLVAKGTEAWVQDLREKTFIEIQKAAPKSSLAKASV